MSLGIVSINAWADRWAELMIAVVWQSTVVAAAIGLVAWVLRDASPGVRYWLWQIAAIKLLVMPLWSVGIPTPAILRPATTADAPIAAVAPDASTELPGQRQAAVDQPAAIQLESTASPPPTASVSLSWKAWLLAIWGVGILAGAARLVAQRARLSRLLAKCRPAGEKLIEQLALVASSLGLARPPQLLVTPESFSPFVCGLLSPRLVLSQAVLEDLSPSDLAPIMAHELAHLRRHDLWWGWIPEIAARIYFFHPVAWWIRSRARLERELACDQMALALTGRTPAEYAQTLVRVVSAAAEGGATQSADGRQRVSARSS